MTPKYFFKHLAESEPHINKVPQLPIKIGKADILAAEMLLWLDGQMPENATVGFEQDVLDAAKWWSQFFASTHAAAD